MKNILLPVVVALSLCCCKKEVATPSYTVESMVVDNAQAATYFHILFREAENAWAVIDSVDYVPGAYTFNGATPAKKKTITYDGAQKVVTINYNAWIAGVDMLGGTITVTLPDVNVYRVEPATANVTLTNNFSINQQRVTGTVTLAYKKPPEGNTNDRYVYTLASGAIYDKDESQRRILITGEIKSGAYERIEGDSTFNMNDDVWSYSGTMTGMLRDDPSMTYTNKIETDREYLINDETRKGPVKFKPGCITGMEGLSQITIPGQSPVTYVYDCSVANYLRETDVQ